MAEPAPSYREKYGYLPGVLMLMLETVGEDAMLKIAAELGGARLSVGPKSLATSPLPNLIGHKLTRALFDRAQRDGLLRFDVPRMGRTLELQRHMRVLRLRAGGTKISEIASLLGMTERNVYLILAADRATPDSRQINFDF